MKKTKRRFFRDKRGIVGIEAAIVLIAFVVIAAALAYVVVNMGFFSAQKAKSTISRGIEESTSALQLDGSVIAYTNETGGTKYVQYLLIPVKLSIGRSSLDLANTTTVISVWGSNLLNIYKGVVNEIGDGGDSNGVGIDFNLPEDPANMTEIIYHLFCSSSETNALGWNVSAAYIIIYNDDDDAVLENFEKAYIVINLGDEGFWRPEYSKVKVEIKTGQGAALVVERLIPGGLPADEAVDLG
ncbi:flagellin [Candidatus Bathyarchaeota archaeon]|nr:flagellin [Candidatus Bathyarchaeota archaeon]